MTDNNKRTFFSKGIISAILLGSVFMTIPLFFTTLPHYVVGIWFWGSCIGLLIMLTINLIDYYELSLSLTFNYPGFIKRQIKLATRLKDDPLLTLEKINIWKRQVIRKIKDEQHLYLFQYERFDRKAAKRYGSTDRDTLIKTLDKDIELLQDILKIVD